MDSIEERKNKANEIAVKRQYFASRQPVWLKLCQRGDMKLIKDSLGIGRISVWQAVHKVTGSLEMLGKIDGFFIEREKALANAKSNTSTGTVGDGGAAPHAGKN